MSARRRGGLGALLLAGTLLSACDHDDVSSADSRAALMAQRTDVRNATSDALAALESGLPGRRSQTPGLGFRPCESSGLETYRNFRYAVRVRVDPAATLADPLGTAGTALPEAGFAVTEPTLAASSAATSALTATRGDVTVTLTSRPDVGPWLIVDADAPCIDVPKDDSDTWLAYRDTEPLE